MSTRVKASFILGFLAALGAALVVPYQAHLLPELREAPLPLWALALISGLQNGIFLGLLGALGLKAGDALGLGAPKLEAWLEGQRPPLRPYLLLLLAGVAAGFAVALLDFKLLLPLVPPPAHDLTPPGGLVALGACFYGGFAEEILTRLFLLTGLAWLLTRLRVPRAPALWIALALAALLFAAGHLPAAAGIWPLTPLVVARVMFMNLALAIPFGVIYLRRGLLAAFALHFGADLGLHILAVELLT